MRLLTISTTSRYSRSAVTARSPLIMSLLSTTYSKVKKRGFNSLFASSPVDDHTLPRKKIKTTLQSSTKNKTKDENAQGGDTETDDADDRTTMESCTLGTQLHDSKLSAKKFKQQVQVSGLRQNLTGEPLTHIFDAGDVSAELFLVKWTILMTTLLSSDLACLLLEIVRQEYLTSDAVFDVYEPMLNILLAAIQDSSVLQKAMVVARRMRTQSVIGALLGRLSELKPKLARQLESEVEQEPLEPSCQMKEQRDLEEDEHLAVLENEADSDDDDFVVDALDEDALRDEEYVPSSESDDSDSSSDSEDELDESDSDAASESEEEFDEPESEAN